MAIIEFSPTGSPRKLQFIKKTSGRKKALMNSSMYKFLSRPINFAFLISLLLFAITANIPT